MSLMLFWTIQWSVMGGACFEIPPENVSGRFTPLTHIGQAFIRTEVEDLAVSEQRDSSRNCQYQDSSNQGSEKRQSQPRVTTDKKRQQSLFDGKTLQGWERSVYGGDGVVDVESGHILIGTGTALTGIRSLRKDIPKLNYAISLEAKRLQGLDMFCGLTFPVADSFCSLIVGGWAGSTVGLSNIADRDASSNPTSRLMKLKDKTWYKIRICVIRERICVYINNELTIVQDIRDKKVSIRDDCDPSRPLGVFTFQTEAAIRNIRLAHLNPKQVKALGRVELPKTEGKPDRDE